MSYLHFLLFFLFKQKTAYEMRISDWSSDVCSSDLPSRLDFPFLALFGPNRPEPVHPISCTQPAQQVHPANDPEPVSFFSEVSLTGSAPSRQIGRASCRERVCQNV